MKLHFDLPYRKVSKFACSDEEISDIFYGYKQKIFLI